MAKKAYRVRNWHDYNKSLVNRGSITFWFSEDLIKEWQTSAIKNTRGRPKVYPDGFILAALTLRQLYRLPLRTMEGFVRSLIELMQLPLKTPDFSTFSVRGKRLQVPLASAKQTKPWHVLIDSTGIQVVGEGEWKTKLHGEARCQLWRKLHIAMDAATQTILGMKVTKSVALDGNQLPDLINQIPGAIEQITGDGAYDKKGCYQTAYKRKAKPVFPPQHDAIVQRNKYKKDPALLARDEVITYIGNAEDKEAQRKRWKINNNYHRRSLVETMMWRMKSIFGDEMRSRCEENQETDLAIRCRIINKMNLLGLPQSMSIDRV